ncbi:MAG: hypothetical protein Q9M50_14270 [Methylococcales bacterium]|nr:hypothetical protein [Methylococcales bacterium]
MTEMYGHLWVSAYGDVPSELWAKAVARLSNDQIKRGLEACLDRDDSYPPNLPTFLKLCKPVYIPLCYRPFKKLSKSECDPKVAKSNLEAMRQALKGV